MKYLPVFILLIHIKKRKIKASSPRRNYSTRSPAIRIFFFKENQLRPTIQTTPFTRINATTIATVENDTSVFVDKNAGKVAITAVTKPSKTPDTNSNKYSFLSNLKTELFVNPMACIKAISRRRSKIVRAKITAQTNGTQDQPQCTKCQEYR